MSDEYDFDDLDLDEDDIAALDAAVEKAHAVKQNQIKQQPPVAKPAPQPQRPPYQASQRAQSVAVPVSRPPLANKIHQRASVPPRPLPLRAPTRPVYKDDFPDVDVTSDGRYAARNGSTSTVNQTRRVNDTPVPQATSAAEVEDLRKKLAEAEETLKEKERIFNTRSGEITVLRNNVTKAQREHQAKLEEQQAQNAALQRQIDALQRASKDEKQRYESEILFARQEHESAVRHGKFASQHPNTVRRNRANGTSGASQSVKAKVNAAPPTKKGFINSFFSPPRKSSQTARVPSSPTAGDIDEEATELSQIHHKDKGKGRAVQDEDNLDSGNDNVMFGNEGQDATFDGDVTVDAVAEHVTTSSRPAFIAHCFAHQTRYPDGSFVKSLQHLLNLNEEESKIVEGAADGQARHKRLCEALFDLLGDAAPPFTGAEELEQQDRAFISRICTIIIRLLSLYNEAGMIKRISIGLTLLRDIFDTFRDDLLHKAILVGQHTAMLLLLVEALAAVAKKQKALIDAAKDAEKAKLDVRSHRTYAAHVHDVNRPKVGDSAVVVAERQAQPIFEAVIDFLAALAWNPDQNCINNFDVVLKDKELFALLLHSIRPLAIIRRCLQLLCLLSSQTALFRTIMAIPIEQNLSRPPQKPQLAFIEAVSAFIMYKAASTDENWGMQRLALVILSTLATEHPDGVPLLGQSSVLVQRMIVRISLDVSQLFDAVDAPAKAADATRMVQHVSHTLLLLHYMLLSKGASRRLADHLLDRPYSRDYFIAGIGRMAFTEPPAWLTDVKDLMTFEHAGNVAHELVGDVLNPDELNELYVLCRDEDDDDMEEDEAEVEAQVIADLENGINDDEVVTMNNGSQDHN